MARMRKSELLEHIRANWFRHLVAKRKGWTDDSRYFEGYATGFLYSAVWGGLISMRDADKAITTAKLQAGL